jgi:Holin of 3TMs, for gene-transfer release
MSLDPITAVSDLATTVVNKIWPDKSEAEKQQLAAAVALVQGQIDTNKAEATNPNVFVSGWRPFIGWVCGSALAYTYIGYPILVWILAIWKPEITVPKLGNDSMLYELMFGMLGMGGLRTFEKVKGVA